MPEKQRLDHDFFTDLFGSGLDHHDGLFTAGHGQVQAGRPHFLVRRIDDQLAIHQPHPDTGNGRFKRNIGNVERRRGSGNGQHVRVVVLVGGHHQGDDLGFAVEALGKQRTERTVNEPGRDNFAFGGASFAFEIAPGMRPEA